MTRDGIFFDAEFEQLAVSKGYDLQFVRMSAPALSIETMEALFAWFDDNAYPDTVVIQAEPLCVFSENYRYSQSRYRLHSLPLKKRLQWFFSRRSRRKRKHKQLENFGYSKHFKRCFNVKALNGFMKRFYDGVFLREASELDTLASMIALAQGQGVKVVLLSIHRSSAAQDWLGAEFVQQSQQCIEHFAAKCQLPYYRIGPLADMSLYRDPVHTNEAGQAALSEELWRVIEPMLQESATNLQPV